jgi:hypothetical protein
MIVVKLSGGLGNQLFQYAAGFALADAHNTSLILDTSFLMGRQQRVTHRKFELHKFDIRAKYGDKLLSPFSHALSPIPRLFKLSTGWNLVNERGTISHSSFFQIPDNTYLVGHWQSPELFKHLGHFLLRHIELKNPLPDEGERYLKKIKGSNSIGIHVRRGDYVTSIKANKYHGVLSAEYYKNAINIMRENVRSPHFFIFSDDINWCKANLALHENEATFLDGGEENAWRDLYLMSRCYHHVIANSSFSWWSTWLADQNYGLSRVVCSPKSWYSSNKSHALQLEHWRVLG